MNLVPTNDDFVYLTWWMLYKQMNETAWRQRTSPAVRCPRTHLGAQAAESSADGPASLPNGRNYSWKMIDFRLKMIENDWFSIAKCNFFNHRAHSSATCWLLHAGPQDNRPLWCSRQMCIKRGGLCAGSGSPFMRDEFCGENHELLY